jgi:CBS domain-containing protein
LLQRSKRRANRPIARNRSEGSARREKQLMAEIAKLFDRKKIKRVPVLRDGKLVGMVKRRDLLRALIGFGGARPGDMRTVEFRCVDRPSK